MNLTSTAAYLTPTLLRRCAALLLALGVMGACSEDEEAPAPQPDFAIAVSSLDGLSPEAPIVLQCDGKLVVAVSLSSSIEKIQFTLRPAGACGTSSKRCGYVRVEALGGDSELLGSADTATTSAVLPLPLERLADVTQLRATLMSGVDKTPILDTEGNAVSATITSPGISVRGDCEEPVGSGGQGGQAGQGGAPAAGAGGTPTEGGASPEGGQAGQGGQGAGGQGGANDIGGAGAGGDVTGAAAGS